MYVCTYEFMTFVAQASKKGAAYALLGEEGIKSEKKASNRNISNKTPSRCKKKKKPSLYTNATYSQP